MIYTVGYAPVYDAGIKRYGSEFKKSGRSATYAGGFACQTVEDAKRLIASETGRGRGWSVYAPKIRCTRRYSQAGCYRKGKLPDRPCRRAVRGVAVPNCNSSKYGEHAITRWDRRRLRSYHPPQCRGRLGDVDSNSTLL